LKNIVDPGVSLKGMKKDSLQNFSSKRLLLEKPVLLRVTGKCDSRIFDGAAGSDKTNYLKQSGITLIELLISVLVLMLFFQGVFLLGAAVYRYAGKVRETAGIKNDADRTFSLIQRDLKPGVGIILYPDNSGISIETKNGSGVSYYGKGDQFLRKSANGIKVLVNRNISDVIWVKNGDILTLNLTFSYSNLNSRKKSTVRILHNFEVKEKGK